MDLLSHRMIEIKQQLKNTKEIRESRAENL